MKNFKICCWFVAMSAIVWAQQATYKPPQLLRGDVPGLPPATVVGGGEVLIEAAIDRRGALTRPVVLRSTPPYTNMVLDTVTRWSFAPALSRIDGADVPVDGSVLIAAIYRPPTLMNGPTGGERPRDLASASSGSPYPVSTVVPTYSTQAHDGSVLLYEVSLDQIGQVANIRGIGADPGFDSAAKQALIQWQFRGATVDGKAVASTVYVIFGFAPPVIGAPVAATPVTSPVAPPVPQLPIPTAAPAPTK